jgi:hypothetical protein
VAKNSSWIGKKLRGGEGVSPPLPLLPFPLSLSPVCGVRWSVVRVLIVQTSNQILDNSVCLKLRRIDLVTLLFDASREGERLIERERERG